MSPGELDFRWNSALSSSLNTLEVQTSIRLIPPYVMEISNGKTEGISAIPEFLPVCHALAPTSVSVKTSLDSNSSNPASVSVNRAKSPRRPWEQESEDLSEIECYQRKFYQSLSEKDRRRYAALESLRYDRQEGTKKCRKIFRIDPKTIRAGIRDFETLEDSVFFSTRIRQPGGGRKTYETHHPEIHEQFVTVLKNHTAGDPMDEKVRWTHLFPSQVSSLIEQDYGTKISPPVVRQLFNQHDYRRRKAEKKQTFKSVAHRDEQFKNILRKDAKYQTARNPVLSMDTKKKEPIGNLYRPGVLYSRSQRRTYDHDFISYADGIGIPHALWDESLNRGYITLGTSKDTSEFACDSIRHWWLHEGKKEYPHATSILIKCDGGGSNSSHSHLFKEDLQKLVNEIGIEIRIAHYPPYTSKYNPIEHRFFPHVTRACQGVVFSNIEIVKELMEKTTTSTGLTTSVRINEKVYETKRKYSPDFKENMPIVFDEFLPQWNYTAVPQ